MINGTKLLNVFNYSRGRRDGILKTEKIRKVVKVGPMPLKGVWISFERAIELASKAGMIDHLFPLFVPDIGRHVQNVPPSAARKGRTERSDFPGQSRPPQLSLSLSDGHGPTSSLASNCSQLPQTPYGMARPALDRAYTVPTPPASAGVMSIASAGTTFGDWPHQPTSHPASSSRTSVDNHQQFNARAIPTPPATTPPSSASGHFQQQYPYPSGQRHESGRSMYLGFQPNEYQSSHGVSARQSLPQYGQLMQPQDYGKVEMGPPPRDLSNHAEMTKQEYEHKQEYDVKHDYACKQEYNGKQEYEQKREYDHDHNQNHNHDYTHVGFGVGGDRSYVYGVHDAAQAPIGQAPGSAVRSSPSNNNSGRATPRSAGRSGATTATVPWPHCVPHGSSQPMVQRYGDDRVNGSSGLLSAFQPPAASQGDYSYPNGASVAGPNNKRLRGVDDDDDGQGSYSRPLSQGTDANGDAKRRMTSPSTPHPRSTAAMLR